MTQTREELLAQAKALGLQLAATGEPGMLLLGSVIAKLCTELLDTRAELAAVKTTLESETAHADALSDLVDGAVLVDEPQQDWQNIPLDLAELVASVGPVAWMQTEPMAPTDLGRMVANSMRLTSDHFMQDYQQPMQYLAIEGTSTVIAYTGTSPASGHITQALAGAWNRLVGDCHIRLVMEGGQGQ